MAVKRRTVWFSDREWNILIVRAQQRGVNITTLIRERVIDFPLATDESVKVGRQPKPSLYGPVTETERASIRAHNAAKKG